MKKIIASIAALGVLGTSLTPVVAAPSFDNTKSFDLSAAKKKKKAKKMKKADNVIMFRIAA